MEDHSQAISFANSYFSLVDGLASGLEDHLDENVVLDWFGRTIRGRKSVTAFMKAHKVASRHIFNNIIPVDGINYRKSQVLPRKLQRPKIDNYVSSLMRRDLNFDKLSISDVDPDNNNVVSKVSGVLDAEGNLEEIDNDEVSMTYDLTGLFTLDIRKTRDEEIEEDIKKIKNEDRIKSASRYSGRMEYGQGDGPDVEDSVGSVKYVEANGQIEFSKKSMKRGTDFQTWKRQSKLQIAYSIISTDFLGPEDREMETDEVSKSKIVPGVPLLPSLNEITEIGNNLVPNINNFGGYLPWFDFTEERDNFLENFNAELSMKNGEASLRTPQYIKNRLVFGDKFNDKPKDLIGRDKYAGGFVFNYSIHLIIYQGSSRCRRSLSEEFDPPIKREKKRSLGKLEL